MFRIPAECYRRNIKKAFVIAIRQSFPCFKEVCGGFNYSCLLQTVNILLWRSLDVQSAGLDLYKMYSFLIEGYNVYLKMSASPVPFKYSVSVPLQEVAHYLFAFPA